MSRRSKYRIKPKKAECIEILTSTRDVAKPLSREAAYTKLKSYKEAFGVEALLDLASIHTSSLSNTLPNFVVDTFYSSYPVCRYNRSNLEEGEP